jgi:hypothetical protein
LSEGVCAVEEQQQYSDIGLERMFHAAKIQKNMNYELRITNYFVSLQR